MEIIIGFVFAFLGLRLSYFVRSTKLSTLNFEPTYNLTMHYQGLERNNSEISPIYPTSTVAMKIETDIPSFQNNFQKCPLHCSCEYSNNSQNINSTSNNIDNNNNNNIRNNNSDSDDRAVTNSTATTTRHSQMRFYRSQASLAPSHNFHLKVSCRYSGFDVPPLSIPLESTHIDLTGNRLLSGSLALLRDCRSLKHLVISECHVRNVADMILGGHDWFLTLISLDASRNRIIYLHNSSFLKMPFLEFLNLSHNRIEFIHKEAFIFLDSLSVLDLSGNRLSSFSDSSWCYYVRQSLVFLDLSSNNIHTISNVPLKLLQKLAHLNLSSNHIKHIQTDTFVNSGSLERLLMADNMIENLPTLDERLERLKYIDLNGNNLPVLARNSFSNLPSLETILLERNPSLLVVEEATFSNMSSLRTVRLNDNNNLAYIDRQAFVNITNLRTLEIRAGSLETLEENVLVSLPCLEDIDISSNPLKCDCVLNWLARQSIGERNYSSQNNNNSVTLRMPNNNNNNKTITLHNYINTSCVNLSNHTNNCGPRILTKLFPKEVLVKMADPLLAYCVAVGNPSPTSYWARRKNHTTYDEVIVYGKRLEIASASFGDQGNYTCNSNSSRSSTSSRMKVSVERLNTSLVLLRLTDTSATMTWKHLDHSREYRIHFKMVFDVHSSDDPHLGGTEDHHLSSNSCPVRPPSKPSTIPRQVSNPLLDAKEDQLLGPRMTPSLTTLVSPTKLTSSSLPVSSLSPSSSSSSSSSSSQEMNFRKNLHSFRTFDHFVGTKTLPQSSSSSSSSPSSSSSSSSLSPAPSSSLSSSSSASFADIKNYMRMFTANDLTPGCRYDFCIDVKLSDVQYHTISCATAVTKLPNHFYAVGFRNIGPTLAVVGGLMFCIFVLVFSCGLGLTRRYDKRQVKRRIVLGDQPEANSSELYLAASVKENTMATEVYFENDAIVSSPDRCSPVFDQADLDEIWDSINNPSEGRGYCESSFVNEPWRPEYYAGACCVETTCRTCGSNVIGKCALSPVPEALAGVNNDVFREVMEEEE